MNAMMSIFFALVLMVLLPMIGEGASPSKPETVAQATWQNF